MYKLLKRPDGKCFWKNNRREFQPVATIVCKGEVYNRMQIALEKDSLVVGGLVSMSGMEDGPYTRIAWLPLGLVDVLKKLPKMEGAKHELRTKS